MNVNNGRTVTFGGNPLAVPSSSTHSLGFGLFASYPFSLWRKPRAPSQPPILVTLAAARGG